MIGICTFANWGIHYNGENLYTVHPVGYVAL